MSEIMQNRRTRENKGWKYSEGRLKLSTSCVECHRRKQKCDQKQPCGHCARRYPPPPCVYRTSREVSKDPYSRTETKCDPTASELIHTSSAEPGSLVQLSPPNGLLPDWLQDNHDSTSLSMETLDKFDPNSYQNLLSSMVSQISFTVLAGAANSEDTFLESPRETRKQHLLVSQDQFFVKQEARTYVPEPHWRIRKEDYLPTPDNFAISSVDPLHFLGITPTVQSSELLQAFLKLITKYVVSIDGNPTPNYYNDYWVPWSVKSPLLSYLGIFTAACYQAEALKVSPGQSPVVLRYKCKVISLLNEMLSHKETSTSTEAITAVVYLAVNEWYWSNYENVQAHMKGLKEMVRLRGGLDKLGMSDFPRRMILLMDFHITCSYNCDLTFPHEIQSPETYPVHMSTPFAASKTGLASSAADLQISQETTTILDDMCFLMTAILQQVDHEPSDKESKKLATTSIWIRDRISSLPEGSESDCPLVHDYIYKSCRIAALIYCKCIVERISLAKSCSLFDLNQLWANMWKVKLSRWKQIPGIFLFIILGAIPAAQDTAHGRFLKSMLKTTSSYIAMENWNIADTSLMAFVKLQRWLRNGGVDVVRRGKQPPLDFLHIYGE